jgi:hypothetical protein
MSVDFQVVYPQQSIALTGIHELVGYTPRALDIRGADFSAVDDVEINDQLSPNWTVLGRQRMLAQVPVQEQESRIYSVAVISNRLTFTKESVLKFRIGSSPGKVTGMMRLIQLFVKVLFTTPGTDIWAPNLGGGLLQMVRGYAGKDEGKGLVGDVAVAVDTSSRQILSLQAQDGSIPPSERLLSAGVSQASYNRHDLSLNVTVELLNQTLRRGFANIST